MVSGATPWLAELPFWQYFKHFVAEIESKPNLSFAVNQSKLSLRCLNFAKKHPSKQQLAQRSGGPTVVQRGGSPVLSPATQIRFVVDCRKGNVNSIYFWRLVLQTKPTDKQKACPPPTFKSEAKKVEFHSRSLKGWGTEIKWQSSIVFCFWTKPSTVSSLLLSLFIAIVLRSKSYLYCISCGNNIIVSCGVVVQARGQILLLSWLNLMQEPLVNWVDTTT